MPLPLIVPIAMGAAGLFGAAKSGKGFWDMSEAKDVNKQAESLLKKHHDKIESLREDSSKALESYGERKLSTITKHFSKFVDVYGKLQNVSVSDFNIEDLKELPSTEAEMAEFVHECKLIVESGKGLMAGGLGGGMVAFGAYNGTMLLASAGTGTAISTLGGAAATNATLAWLGGGTLASGGLGVAGGTAVLGVMAAGPALAVMGFMVGAKGKESLNNARSNLEKAETAVKELEGVEAQLKYLIEVVTLANGTLSRAKLRFRRALGQLEEVIEQQGVDVQSYSQEQQDKVFAVLKLAQLIKVLIDQPILQESGEVIDGVKENLKQTAKQL